MKDEKNKPVSWMNWIIMFISPMVLIATLFFPTIIESGIQQEVRNLSKLMGQSDANSLYKTAADLSSDLMVESGAVDYIREVLLPKEYLNGLVINEQRPLNTRFWRSIDNAIYALLLNLDLTFLRFLALKIWIVAIVLITFTSIVSGLLIREIKKQGFEYSSPMRHGIGRKVMYNLPFLTCLYFVLPFAMPSYTIPIVTLVYASALILIVSNTIKRV